MPYDTFNQRLKRLANLPRCGFTWISPEGHNCKCKVSSGHISYHKCLCGSIKRDESRQSNEGRLGGRKILSELKASVRK